MRRGWLRTWSKQRRNRVWVLPRTPSTSPTRMSTWWWWWWWWWWQCCCCWWWCKQNVEKIHNIDFCHLSDSNRPRLLLDCLDVIAFWHISFHIFPHKHRVRIPGGEKFHLRKRSNAMVVLFSGYLLARSLTLSMHLTLLPSSLRISKKPSYVSGMANFGPTGTTWVIKLVLMNKGHKKFLTVEIFWIRPTQWW